MDKRVHLNLVIHNPIEIHFSQKPQHSCRRFLSFFFFFEMAFLRLQVPSKFYLHGCRRMDPWLLLPRLLLFLDILRSRDAVGSERVAAVCSGLCARSWVS